MQKENTSNYIYQIQADINVSSFLTVVAVFFLGSLLPRFNSYDIGIKVPISFLTISTFSFLFSAIILSNAVPKIIEQKFQEVEKYFSWRYSIFEYLGVHLFIISISLTINVITDDTYLRLVTFFAAIFGIIFYQLMGFSILKNHFNKHYRFFSYAIIILSILIFLAQIYNFYLVAASVAFIFFIFLITVLAPKEEFQ